jgi:hypothetical protein
MAARRLTYEAFFDQISDKQQMKYFKSMADIFSEESDFDPLYSRIRINTSLRTLISKKLQKLETFEFSVNYQQGVHVEILVADVVCATMVKQFEKTILDIVNKANLVPQSIDQLQVRILQPTDARPVKTKRSISKSVLSALRNKVSRRDQ